jgi:hypothetical protein
MTYIGRVEHGVIKLDGPQRPPDGTIVRVEEVAGSEPAGGSETHQASASPRLSDDEFKEAMDWIEANGVSVPNVDDSREAIYTRMPGE